MRPITLRESDLYGLKRLDSGSRAFGPASRRSAARPRPEHRGTLGRVLERGARTARGTGGHPAVCQLRAVPLRERALLPPLRDAPEL